MISITIYYIMKSFNKRIDDCNCDRRHIVFLNVLSTVKIKCIKAYKKPVNAISTKHQVHLSVNHATPVLISKFVYIILAIFKMNCSQYLKCSVSLPHCKLSYQSNRTKYNLLDQCLFGIFFLLNYAERGLKIFLSLACHQAKVKLEFALYNSSIFIHFSIFIHLCKSPFLLP